MTLGTVKMFPNTNLSIQYLTQTTNSAFFWGTTTHVLLTCKPPEYHAIQRNRLQLKNMLKEYFVVYLVYRMRYIVKREDFSCL